MCPDFVQARVYRSGGESARVSRSEEEARRWANSDGSEEGHQVDSDKVASPARWKMSRRSLRR
jgi:hypothetical protein